MTTLVQRAAAFRSLHDEGILVLPNCWDAGSARIMAAQGAPALATSSAAVAWALGYGDGDKLPVAKLTACLSAITRNLDVPLTADIEGGYSDDPAKVGETVAAVIDAGAVGINLEDGRSPPALLARKIEAARKAAERAGVALFINARCDVFLKGLVPAEQRVAETLVRAGQYRAAGADGLFAAGARSADDIAALAAGTPLALNILALPGVPNAAALAKLGVRRVTSGSGIAESVYGHVARLTRAFLADGDGAPLAADALGYGEINTLLGKD